MTAKQFEELRGVAEALIPPLKVSVKVQDQEPPPAQVQVDVLLQTEAMAAPDSHHDDRHKSVAKRLARRFGAVGKGLLRLSLGQPVAEVGNCTVHRRSCWRPRVVLAPHASLCIFPAIIAVAVNLLVVYAAVVSVVPGDEPHQWSLQIMEVFTALGIFFMALTAAVDPGYLVPALPSPSESPAEFRCSRSTEVRGVAVEQKWCRECNFLRPLRAAHCYTCGLCVEELDHHCDVLGVCVGRRNIRFFALFLVSFCVAFEHAVVVWFTLVRAARGFFTFVALIFPAVLLLPVAIGVHGMAFFLLMNAAKNATLRERIRRTWMNVGNPFSDGCLRNCGRFWCSPLGSPPITEEWCLANCSSATPKGEVV